MGAIAIFTPVLALAAYALFGVHGMVASAAGSILAFVNLWAVARVVRGLVAETQLRSRWSLLAFLKMLALIGVVYALVAGGFPILAVALGYSAMPLGIVVGQLWTPAPAAEDPAPHKG
jgi:hypothetical protein